VRLRYRDAGLTIEVDDDGIGPVTRPNGGSGIAGMRERALALGGDIEAGRLPGRGFRVTARLPLQGAS